VREFPQVVPEHLFVKIPEQVERLNTHVGSLDSALQERPEVFEAIGVDLPINIFLCMVDYLVLEILMLQSLIGHKCIGINRTTRFDVGANLGLQVMFAASGNHHCADFAAAFENAHDRSFVLGSSLSNPATAFVLVHIPRCAADERFVYFDCFSFASEFEHRTVLHCKPDAMEHEPSRLLSDAERTSDFVRTDAILAVGNHPDGNKPLVEWERRIFKDSPDLGAKLPFGMDTLALPFALIGKEHGVLAPASRAFNAVGPA